MNAVTLTGNIKNVVTRNENVRTANLSQRGADNKCITTMPLVFLGENLGLPVGIDESKNVKITGRLVTRFDRRPGIENKDRFKPFTQIEVSSLEVVVPEVINA